MLIPTLYSRTEDLDIILQLLVLMDIKWLTGLEISFGLNYTYLYHAYKDMWLSNHKKLSSEEFKTYTNDDLWGLGVQTPKNRNFGGHE